MIRRKYARMRIKDSALEQEVAEAIDKYTEPLLALLVRVKKAYSTMSDDEADRMDEAFGKLSSEIDYLASFADKI